MKSVLPRNYSRDEFERLSHPEKLQYLTELLNALDASANKTLAAAAIDLPAKPSGQSAD